MQTKMNNICHYDPDHAADSMRYYTYNLVYTHQNGAHIKDVIFNDPATIVFWGDGTKTVVKKSKDDIWDPEKGLAMAIVKKCFGHTNMIKKWTDGEVKEKNINKSLSVANFITNVTYLKNDDLYTETIDKKE